ncbi:MAG: RHS repeat-associated core domain-containing protein, partial [Chitinophagaceae bacterium]
TGLDWYSYGMREYDPQLGRFPQLDPLTDEFPTLTPYQYASNDPVANIDWDGLEGFGATGGIVGGVHDFTYSYQTISDATALWHPIMQGVKAASTSGKFIHVVLPTVNMALHAVQVTGTIINGPMTTKEAGNAAGNRPQVGPGPQPLGPIGELFMMTVGQGMVDINTILTGRDGNNNKAGAADRVMAGVNLIMLGAGGEDGEVPEMKGEIPEIKVPNPKGRLGGEEHQALVGSEADRLEKEGYTITGGGGKAKEEYLPSLNGSRKGSNYVDITATKDGETVRVQVGKQNKNGTPVSRERKNLEMIRQKKPNDELWFLPYNYR